MLSPVVGEVGVVLLAESGLPRTVVQGSGVELIAHNCPSDEHSYLSGVGWLHGFWIFSFKVFMESHQVLYLLLVLFGSDLCVCLPKRPWVSKTDVPLDY